MKKKTVQLLLSLVVLATMGGLYVHVKSLSENEQNETSESTEQEEENVEVLSFEQGSIQGIKFLIDGEEVSFVKEEGTWKKEDEPDFPLSQKIVENAVSSIECVEADYVIKEAEDLSEYDLQQPINVITISEENGIQTELRVGLKNEDGQYYVCKADEKNVYLIDESAVSSFMKELYNYSEMHELPTIEADTIKSIKVEKADAEYELQKKEDSLWYVKGKEDERADTTKMDALLYKTAALSYKSLVNYHCENDADYGLEEPYAVVSIAYQTEEETETAWVDQELVLYVGDSTADGYRYVKTEGSNEVYMMSESMLESLTESSAEDFWNLSVFYLSMNELESLKVEYDGETNICNVSRETLQEEEGEEKDEDSEQTEETRYFMDDIELDYLKFSSFYNKLVNFEAAERLIERPEMEKTACFTAEFTDLSGNIEKMEIFEFNEDFYMISMNESYYLVNKMNVKDMINAFEALK